MTTLKLQPAPEVIAVEQATVLHPSAITTGIANVQTEVAKFDQIATGLKAIEDAHPKNVIVAAINTPAGMKQAEASWRAYRNPRVEVERARKAAKAPVLALGRAVDEFAAGLETRLREGEDHYKAQIDGEVSRREEERAARAAAELARVEALKKRIDYLRGIAPRAAGKPAAEVSAKIAMVEGITIGPDFAEFQSEAQDVHAQVLEQLRDMHTATVAQEEAAARVKAESERLARVDHYGRKLMELRSLSVGMSSRSAAAIRVALDTLRTLAIDAEGWAEFAPQAEEARTAVLAELSQMLEAAETREAIAAQQAHEAQRLAAQKAEQDRVAAEQRAAELQRQQEADARAESARLEALAVERRAQQAATTYSSGAPMFSSTHVKENGDLMMLDEQGKRSVFCDVDEGTTEGQATQLCMCKDRPLSACPGEWEPGCDLGNNPAHVVVVEPGRVMSEGSAQAGIELLQATGPVLIGIDPGAPEGDRTVYAEIPAAIETGHAPSAYAEDIAALAAEARASRFPSQPKMEPAWWARFYALADRMGGAA